MQININQIPEDGIWLEFHEKADIFPALKELLQSGECRFIDALKVRVRLMRIRDIIEVEGTIETRVGLNCARCLEPFAMPIAGRFQLTYTQVIAESSPSSEKEEIELQADEMRMIAFEGDILDLRDAIQDQVVMSLPLQPLCSPDCKGLCPHCGANLNEGVCDCDKTPQTSPFAVLKKLNLG